MQTILSCMQRGGRGREGEREEGGKEEGGKEGKEERGSRRKMVRWRRTEFSERRQELLVRLNSNSAPIYLLLPKIATQIITLLLDLLCLGRHCFSLAAVPTLVVYTRNDRYVKARSSSSAGVRILNPPMEILMLLGSN